MYELVYYATRSRIAEKMLEKAILISKDNTGSKILECFTNVNSFINTDDESLLSILNESGNFPKDIINRIREDELYDFSTELVIPLNEDVTKMGSKIVPDLARDDGSQLGEAMTVKLCDELGVQPYHIICDILKSRVPKRIDINEYDKDGEPIELYRKSDVLPALKEKPTLKMYTNPNVHIPNKTIRDKALKLVEGWQ
jgi:HD superfamily phosphohydrolase